MTGSRSRVPGANPIPDPLSNTAREMQHRVPNMTSRQIQMKHNHTAHAQTPEDLLNDLRSLVAEAEKMLGDSIGERAADAVATLRARFDAAHERFTDLYENAKDRVVDSAKRTDQVIRTNPYQSIAVAAGVGLLVGVLVGRRGR